MPKTYAFLSKKKVMLMKSTKLCFLVLPIKIGRVTPRGSLFAYSWEALVPKGKVLNENFAVRRLKGHVRNKEENNNNNRN